MQLLVGAYMYVFLSCRIYFTLSSGIPRRLRSCKYKQVVTYYIILSQLQGLFYTIWFIDVMQLINQVHRYYVYLVQVHCTLAGPLSSTSSLRPGKKYIRAVLASIKQNSAYMNIVKLSIVMTYLSTGSACKGVPLTFYSHLVYSSPQAPCPPPCCMGWST